MKKRILSIFLLLSICFGLCACSNSESNETGSTIKESSEKVTETDLVTNDSEIDELFKDVKFLGTENNVKISNYKGLTLTVGKKEITEKDIETEINYMLSNNYYYEKIFEGNVKDKDTVNVSFVGTIDGIAFEGGSAEDTFVTVGENKFIDGFEESLIGAEPGEKVIADVTFPEDYGVETLNGKEAQFEITLNYICGEEVKAELTDEFISAYTDYKTVEEYKAFVKKELEDYYQKDFEENKDSYYWNAVQELLVDEADVKSLNKEEVYEYYLGMLDYYESYASYFGYSFDKLCETFFNLKADEFKKELVQISIDAITFNSVIGKISEAENIVVSEEEYSEKLDKIVEEYGYSSKEDLLTQIEANNEKEDIKLEILQKKIVDFIVNNSTVKEISISE